MLNRTSALAVGFITLLSFSLLGIWQTNQNTDAVRKLGRREAYDNCVAINKGFQATRLAATNAALAQISQAEAISNRFNQNLRLNPPVTAQQKASSDAGEKFFSQYIQDTKDLARTGVKNTFAKTVPQKCEK